MRFDKGDLVRLVVTTIPSNYGSIYEIEEVGPFRQGSDGKGSFYIEGGDYLCTDGETVWDWQLAPIQPPAEPVSLTRSEEVSV